MKKSGFFWVSYADLMTTLFFVMLVLYIITFALLQKQVEDGTAAKEKLKEIENVERALQSLDSTYFEFDKINKRYKLKVEATFAPGSDDFYDSEFIKSYEREAIRQAGNNLYERVKKVIKDNPNVDYLLVIEGNTQRLNNNWQLIPDEGYKLSYRRALALYNYWNTLGIDFRGLGTQCEVIIAGSGYFGQSRDVKNEVNNRKFTIQITSKVGKFLQQQSNNNSATIQQKPLIDAKTILKILNK